MDNIVGPGRERKNPPAFQGLNDTRSVVTGRMCASNMTPDHGPPGRASPTPQKERTRIRKEMPMLKILGRKNSSNVQKVIWACDEMSLPFQREDIGGSFGRNKDPEYLALNPNG